jgi:hypothetical protein
MLKNLVIFEVEGGNDKSIFGFRKDTFPIVDAFKKMEWKVDVLFYRVEWEEDLFNFIIGKYHAFLSRVNPGNLNHGEEIYLHFLSKLINAGIVGFSNPFDMSILGSKDILLKLKKTNLIPDDTVFYNSFNKFYKNFAKSLLSGTRVIKQNRGSTGNGIWKIEIEKKSILPNGNLSLKNTIVKFMEAANNQIFSDSLENFLKMCLVYFKGPFDGILNMPYLKEIINGEYRVLMVGKTIIKIIHKIPKEINFGFSATLNSGANYIFYEPDTFPIIKNLVLNNLNYISLILNKRPFPLFWTMDFIPSEKPETFYLSEINCSCVGFTNLLNDGVQEAIADEAEMVWDLYKKSKIGLFLSQPL